MLFHSHEFFALLAATVLLFRLLPDRRRAVMLAGSIAFYAYSGLGVTALFLSVAFISYRCFCWIREGRGRWPLVLGLTVNLVNLFTFKYALFFLNSLEEIGLHVAAQQDWVSLRVVLPIGISFYTFQLVAVLIDEHRGSKLGVSSFSEFLLFISFFGQLIAGPIMRGHEFFPQLHRLSGPTPRQIFSGALLFGTGLVKKVIITDQLLAPRVDALFASAQSWDAPTSWLMGALFGFQIYFDFSGYVDMALGLGRFFGLELQRNFSTPYVSRTPSEFWARWNITLSRWFGDYVYIPLGGSRGGSVRTARNLLITMLASGLWHGAGFTYVIWGGIHGVYLVLFHMLRRARPHLAERLGAARPGIGPVVGWVLTYAVATVAWIYFRASSVAEANAVVANMFGFGSGVASGVEATLLAVAAGSLALHFLERLWLDRTDALIDGLLNVWLRMPGPAQAAVVFPLVIATLGLTKKVMGAFIYFQF